MPTKKSKKALAAAAATRKRKELDDGPQEPLVKVRKTLNSIIQASYKATFCDFDVGMPGTFRLTGMLNVMKAMGLKPESTFIDLGSGQGVPCMVAAAYFNVKGSYGIELGKEALAWSHYAREKWIANEPSFHNVHFQHDDIFKLADLRGATHVYTCDAAFPPALLFQIAKLLEQNDSWEVFASTLKPRFWFEEADCENLFEYVTQETVRMGVSGEQRQFFVFKRKNVVKKEELLQHDCAKVEQVEEHQEEIKPELIPQL